MSGNYSETPKVVGAKSGIKIRIASNPEQIKEAFRLVQHAYVRCGLAEPNACGMRVTPYHLLPTTAVLVADVNGEVACTVSLVRDGEFGLPMEAIYGEEVAQRRRQGISLAEATCLADRRRSFVRGFPLLARLMAFTIQCAKYRGVEELLIAVHPKHGRFYQRYLGFRQVGGEKTYEAVRGRPAIAMALDIPQLSVDHPVAYKRVFGNAFREGALRGRPVPAEFLEELRSLVEAESSLGGCPEPAFVLCTTGRFST